MRVFFFYASGQDAFVYRWVYPFLRVWLTVLRFLWVLALLSSSQSSCICDLWQKSWTNWDLNETAWSEHLPKSTLPLLAPHHPPIMQNFMTGDGDCCSFHGWHIDSLYGAQNINICWHYVSCGGQGGTGAFEPDWASSNCPHKGDCKQSQVAHSRENSGKIILIPISCCVWESLKKKKRKKKELNQLWDWLAFG